MTAVWRPGAQHKVVDCFSRHPVEDADSDDDGADIDACLMATLAAVNADDDSGETIMEDAHIVQVSRTTPTSVAACWIHCWSDHRRTSTGSGAECIPEDLAPVGQSLHPQSRFLQSSPFGVEAGWQERRRKTAGSGTGRSCPRLIGTAPSGHCISAKLAAAHWRPLLPAGSSCRRTRWWLIDDWLCLQGLDYFGAKVRAFPNGEFSAAVSLADQKLGRAGLRFLHPCWSWDRRKPGLVRFELAHHQHLTCASQWDRSCAGWPLGGESSFSGQAEAAQCLHRRNSNPPSPASRQCHRGTPSLWRSHSYQPGTRRDSSGSTFLAPS